MSVAGDRTVALIKPDAFARKKVGAIIAVIEENLKIETIEHWPYWGWGVAQDFYARQHFGMPYYADLIRHMMSGPVLSMILSGEDAIQGWRKIMGPSDPSKRTKDTIRGLLAADQPQMLNLVHGSDSYESFKAEVGAIAAYRPEFARGLNW